jgi:hypothetical protein
MTVLVLVTHLAGLVGAVVDAICQVWSVSQVSLHTCRLIVCINKYGHIYARTPFPLRFPPIAPAIPPI